MDKNQISSILKKFKSDGDILHDLMPVRVREILLVATIYDAYTIEQDGFISEMIFSEFYRLNLSHAPRITSVASESEALNMLRKKKFDLVIIAGRNNRFDYPDLSREIKSGYPHIPVLLLLNDNAGITVASRNKDSMQYFDKVFVWNGNSQIFLAMVKLTEDKANIHNDTSQGLVRIILLVEDSIRYYSRLLPLLYNEVMKQTRRLIEDEKPDELTRMLKRRVRPKILLASNYEEAIEICKTFSEYLLCVISDVAYPRNGTEDEFAGIRLITELREFCPELPVVLQSSEHENLHLAAHLNAGFINKESESLEHDLTEYFYRNLGFGDFVFRDKNGKRIARARSLRELKTILNHIPAESIVYHASKDHFSAWLTARGELQTAKAVFNAKLTDFQTAEELRKFLVDSGESIQKNKIRGIVIPFDEESFTPDISFVRLRSGSLGGKGRGLSFIHSLLCNIGIARLIPDMHTKLPFTAIIGTDEFSWFLERHSLTDLIRQSNDFDMIRHRFLECDISQELECKLKKLLECDVKPLAVRSSGALENSLSHPLTGLYHTFFVPNNHPDISVRYKQLTDAIKLVFASVYSQGARDLFRQIDYKIEEEKMAVVIQEIAGSKSGNYFRPDFSGVARSLSHSRPLNGQICGGSVTIARGLGKYLSETGDLPSLQSDICITNLIERIKAQKYYYGLNMGMNTVNFLAGDIATLDKLSVNTAESEGINTVRSLTVSCTPNDHGSDAMHKSLHDCCVSVEGAHVLTSTLQTILKIAEDAMEMPVEIEFAVVIPEDCGQKPDLYLLEVKHLPYESAYPESSQIKEKS